MFYTTGGVTLLWSILWFSLVHDLPEDHPRFSMSFLKLDLEAFVFLCFIMICRISAEERDMIVAGRSFDAKAQEEELKTPTLPLVGSF